MLKASHKALDSSLLSSREHSGKVVDRTALTRLVFPGGWENKSDIFEWYALQRYTSFRKLRYYKDHNGVGHEFVVLLLDDDLVPTESFCRLERTPDPAEQLAVIGTKGIEAFDYIQMFDANLERVTKGAAIVAEISFPRVFDLHDVLAVCSAVSEHPLAHRYTLQQYNCYFFSWTIILSLARRAADWENLFSMHISSIKATVLSAISSPPSKVENAKLAYILSAAHAASTIPAQGLLHDVLASEMSNLEFIRLASEALGSALWVHSGHAKLKEALKVRSMGLAEQTVELLVVGLDVDLNKRLMNSLRGEIALGPGLNARELGVEGTLLYDTVVRGIKVDGTRKEAQRVKDKRKHNCLPPNSTQSPSRSLSLLPVARTSITFMKAAFQVLPEAISDALETARVYNEMADHKEQPGAVRKLNDTIGYIDTASGARENERMA